jgi:hypothetical protein
MKTIAKRYINYGIDLKDCDDASEERYGENAISCACGSGAIEAVHLPASILCKKQWHRVW